MIDAASDGATIVGTKAAKADRPSGRLWRRVALAGLVLLALLYGAHRAIVYYVGTYIHDEGIVVTEEAGRAEILAGLQREAAAVPPGEARLIAAATPFDEVPAFDDDAKDWSNMFSQYAAGVVTFDANGDGRLDVYFCQDGENWTRPTDPQGVLLAEPRHQHNILYLNQGNDTAGNPVFAQVEELARGNDTFLAEELAIENFLFPRSSLADPVERTGRKAQVAVAADFDGDGRPDLLVGNGLPGMLWSAPETQSVLWQFVSPVGRRSRYSKQALTAMGPYLVRYEAKSNLEDRRESARGIEAYGADSLFLNLGDRDRDGIPEWRDASREAGIEGVSNTSSLAVADIDLDGDLDLYTANLMDTDYWPGGAKGWAGAANDLFVNQLAETGKLTFLNRAAEMNVDGVYDADFPMPEYYRLRRVPYLPPEYSFVFLKYEPYYPQYLKVNGVEAEHGEISWASTFQDVDRDGYPDLWVANDFGYLRLYMNEKGKRFRPVDHTALHTSGHWMALVPADFDGDLMEDLWAGNLGGAVFSHAFAGADPFDLFDPVIESATLSSLFINGEHDPRHVVIDGKDVSRRFRVGVRHSTVLPPDASLPDNTRELRTLPNGLPFDRGSLDPYEFAWGATSLDVQNDGALDLYYHGSLYGRGGGLSAILGTGPGRLLVNGGGGAAAGDRRLRWLDLTAEHHVFNIQELRYDRMGGEGYVYRRAPTKNWTKRDVVYSYDRSTWTQQGPRVQQKVANHDLIQVAEAGRGAIASDLNGDGFPDLLLRNGGGYDTRSSKANNLKTLVDGRPQVLPAHSYHYPVPTDFEPGSTRLFVNRYSGRHWLKVRLLDTTPGSLNRDAIGARVVVNGRLLRVQRAGDGSFVSNRLEDLHFGLGDGTATSVEVHWPDRARTVTRAALDGLADGTLTIAKDGGVVGFAPGSERGSRR